MDRPFLAAAVQLSAGSDKARNLATATRLVRSAVDRGAELVTLPEQFSWRGRRGEEFEIAESIPGPSTAWMRDLARDLGVDLLAGSILERARGTRKVYNTSILVDRRGRIRGRYRKVHLFDVDVPGAATIRESDTRLHGDRPVLGRTDRATLGLSVCYDLRFPELYRRLTLRGAEILTVPAAFTHKTGEAHWEPLLRARAIENQCYVIAPNQFGKGPLGIRCYGHSLVVDPWGRVLDRVERGSGVALARIDPGELDRVRGSLPSLRHVRLAGHRLPRAPGASGPARSASRGSRS